MDIFWYRHVKFLGYGVVFWRCYEWKNLGWVGNLRPWLLVGFCQALGWFSSTDGCSGSAEKVPTFLFGSDMEVMSDSNISGHFYVAVGKKHLLFMVTCYKLLLLFFYYLGMILLPVTAANEGLFCRLLHRNPMESSGIPTNCRFFTRSHWLKWSRSHRWWKGYSREDEDAWNIMKLQKYLLHDYIAAYRKILDIGISTLNKHRHLHYQQRSFDRLGQTTIKFNHHRQIRADKHFGGKRHFILEEILHHLGFVKPCKKWDKLPTSTGAGFLPPTVPTNSWKTLTADSASGMAVSFLASSFSNAHTCIPQWKKQKTKGCEEGRQIILNLQTRCGCFFKTFARRTTQFSWWCFICLKRMISCRTQVRSSLQREKLGENKRIHES